MNTATVLLTLGPPGRFPSPNEPSLVQVAVVELLALRTRARMSSRGQAVYAVRPTAARGRGVERHTPPRDTGEMAKPLRARTGHKWRRARRTAACLAVAAFSPAVVAA